MTNQIYPCLWFDGHAKAAAVFYCALFSDSKITLDSPMVVNFELAGQKLMGLNGGPMFKINPSISLFVLCESMEETDTLWNNLMEGGSVMMPLDKYSWSEKYGWLKDKFGLTWQISIATNGAKQKITPSFLFTAQQFGRAEEAITFYSKIFKEFTNDTLIHYGKDDAHAGKVMYSEFRLNTQAFIAMDGPGTHEYTFNEGVSLVVECETQDEIDHYWNSLTAHGGQESMCGWLKDKFGVSWQIIPRIIGQLITDAEKGPRAMQALMQMKKITIDNLVNA